MDIGIWLHGLAIFAQKTTCDFNSVFMKNKTQDICPGYHVETDVK